MYISYYVFETFLPIFLLFHFPSVIRNSIAIKLYNYLMLPNNSLSFVTNNVKGIQASKKRMKLTQYLKD